tara:strand:- start:3330 stop:3527 length:198 start_codon:yes stop_codon:yes gene_type:complete
VEIIMSKLVNYKSGNFGVFANIDMDNGDRCFISVAQTGVMIQKKEKDFSVLLKEILSSPQIFRIP